MYSQFSEVRFSSVALAVLRSVTAWSFWTEKLTNGVIKCILLGSEHSYNYFRGVSKGKMIESEVRNEENEENEENENRYIRVIEAWN